MVEPLKSLEEGLEQLNFLVSELSRLYDFQYDKNIDLNNLGEAVDALMFATTKLTEQKKLQAEAEKTRLAQLTGKGN